MGAQFPSQQQKRASLDSPCPGLDGGKVKAGGRGSADRLERQLELCARDWEHANE